MTEPRTAAGKALDALWDFMFGDYIAKVEDDARAEALRCDCPEYPCEHTELTEDEKRKAIERKAVKPYVALLVRLRQYDHDRHDKGSDEQRAKGDYGPTPVETCRDWFCYHVGVYLRHAEAENALLASGDGE